MYCRLRVRLRDFRRDSYASESNHKCINSIVKIRHISSSEIFDIMNNASKNFECVLHVT